MAASDIRQGRAGREDVGALIRGLRLMADAGVVNGPRDKAALRQAAGMLEKQAFLPKEDERDYAGLLEECAALRARCMELEQECERKRGEAIMYRMDYEATKKFIERYTLPSSGLDVGYMTGAQCAPLRRMGAHGPGIDFEAPAPTVLW